MTAFEVQPVTPFGQESLASTTPSASASSTQTDGSPTQTAPGSIAQLAEQPSPFTVFPSSQLSKPASPSAKSVLIMPSPQTASTQPALHASLSETLPSSQASNPGLPGSTSVRCTPSPQKATAQVFKQPSSSTLFPSSQVSLLSVTESPQ